MILCDADGVVLSRRTGDSALEHHLNRVWLAPGFSYAEQFVGTNGIGTALEARGPAQVFGHEHFVERAGGAGLRGAPIRHPVTGKVLGVIDLTCWQRDAGPLLVATAATLTRRIEAMLLEQSGQRELAVLNDYLVACRRNRGPVLAARRRPADDERPGARAARPRRPGAAAGRGERGTGRGAPAPAAHRPAERPDGARAHPADGQRTRDRRRRPRRPADQLAARRRRPARLLAPSPRSTAVGLRRGLDQVLRGRWTATCWPREWLVLEGEPGSGRETVARAAHQLRTPAARLRVLAAEDAGPDWAAEVAEELATTGGSLVLTDVDRLPGDAADRAGRAAGALPRVAPTPTGPGSSPPCVRRRANPRRSWPTCCPASRARSSSRRSGTTSRTSPSWSRTCSPASPTAASLTVSPEAMRVLTHNRWPGNVDQLVAVLRKVVATRRTGRGGAAGPAARVLVRHEAGAHPAGVAGVRRHRGGPARQRGQQGRGGPPAGRCPGPRSTARSATTASRSPPPSRSARAEEASSWSHPTSTRTIGRTVVVGGLPGRARRGRPSRSGSRCSSACILVLVWAAPLVLAAAAPASRRRAPVRRGAGPDEARPG